MGHPVAGPLRLPNGEWLDERTPHGAWTLLRDAAEGARLPATPVERWSAPFEGVMRHWPRAVNARHTLRGEWRATEGGWGGGAASADDGGYWVGEKLDGVYVCWTGARLITKTGRVVEAPAFTSWLPPGFPLVGELYCGNNTLAAARSLVTHPRPATLARWANARLVAFDVPGLEPAERWPYHARYALLRHVVAAWGHRQRDREPAPDLWPLQLLRQRPATPAVTTALFRDVVHGATWAERTAGGTVAFGVPVAVVVRLPDGTRLCVADNNRERWLSADTDPFDATATDGGSEGGGALRASGEGCMLWRADAPWTARGGGGRGTLALLKYKPVVLLAARITEAPHHSHRTAFAERERDPLRGGPEEDGEADGTTLPGYRLPVEWVPPFAPRAPLQFSAWVPPQWPEPVARAFPVDGRTFVACVGYGTRPLYTRALGPTLGERDARSVQEHALGEARGRQESPSGGGAPGAAQAVPPLTRLREAAFWTPGEMRALFPCDVDWSPRLRCERASASRWLRPHAALVGAGRATVAGRVPPRGRRTAPEWRAWREAVAARWEALPVDRADRGVARDLLGMLWATRAWLQRPSAGAVYERDPDGGGLVRRFGPFQVRGSGDDGDWARTFLAAWLTLACDVWRALIPALGRFDWDAALREDPGVVDRLHARVWAYVVGLAGPRWAQPAVRDALCPADRRVGLWPRSPGAQPLDARGAAAHTAGAACRPPQAWATARQAYEGAWRRYVEGRGGGVGGRRARSGDDEGDDVVQLQAAGLRAAWSRQHADTLRTVDRAPGGRAEVRIAWDGPFLPATVVEEAPAPAPVAMGDGGDGDDGATARALRVAWARLDDGTV